MTLLCFISGQAGVAESDLSKANAKLTALDKALAGAYVSVSIKIVVYEGG